MRQTAAQIKAIKRQKLLRQKAGRRAARNTKVTIKHN